MAAAKSPVLDDRLKQMASGAIVDWKGATISAARLRDLLVSATGEARPSALVVRNAKIIGNLLLDELGDLGTPLTLQIIGCMLESLRARSSHWRQLIIAKSSCRCIDMPGIQVDRELLIEACKASGWLELRGARVGGSMTLTGSSFHANERDHAVMLAGSVVGQNLNAQQLTAMGCVQCDRISVGGNLEFNGALLDGRNLTAPKALDLSRAQAGGQLQLVPGERRFVAYGRIHVNGAEFGAVVVKAALLDGCGQPAVVGDQMRVRETLDLGGLSDTHQPRLEVKGQLHFGSSTIGNQIQLHDALLEADGEVLILHNCRVGGDVLIGQQHSSTRLKGGINANLCVLEGRLQLENIDFDAPGEAIGARQARIEKEIGCHDLRSNGPFRFDNTAADGLSLENVELIRSALPPVRLGLPEPYAQPEDALLDINFMQLKSDFRAENIVLRNGNLRMIGAQINGGVQLSRISIDAGGRLALVAQSARLTGGFLLSGTPAQRAEIRGEVNLMSARIDGDLTVNHVSIGSDDVRANLIMRNISVEAGVLVNESELHGQLNVSGAQIAGDLHVHSTVLSNTDAVACDVGGARINGQLQWATARRKEGVACSVEGGLTADGAIVGALSWNGLRLGDGTYLVLTNIRAEQRIDCAHLVCDGIAQIDLSGTTTPLLVDYFGGENDSWSTARLGLDNFNYRRLARPSGGNGDEAGAITTHRRAWLNRRFDLSSARPARHLGNALREQGLFEASRRILMIAFAAEGEARPTEAGRAASRLFGLFFGHGLSGSRAALTVILVWLLGAAGFACLHQRDLLVPTNDTPVSGQCGARFDPFLYAIDVMIPLDLGEESQCRVGASPGASLVAGRPAWQGWTVGGTLAWATALAVLYRLLAWLVISLAIATWSGLFKRGGRE
jgi:hypothetical protein